MDILMIGHSLIEFYDWQERFLEHNVANLGVAGETVEGLRDRLGDIMSTYQKADKVFVMTGANNIAMEDYNFMGPYEGIIMRLASFYRAAEIYVYSVLPIILEWVPGKKIEEINESVRILAQKTGVAYLNIYRHFVDRDGNPVKEYLLDDGVHLSNKGYEVWSGIVEEIIDS